MRKVIINLAPTGMVPTKQMTRHVPISVTEIVETALACAELGVAIVHLHPRDKFGKPTWEAAVYAEIIGAIRQHNKKLVISVSTSGRDWSEFAKRSECLELSGKVKPDLASLTVGSMNFINQESVNSPSTIERLATKMMEKGIKPELEIFEPGMIHKAKYLLDKGIIVDAHPYFNLLLGSLGTSPLELPVWSAMLSMLPPAAVWSVAGIGRYQLDANVASLALGGHVRVGLEDNIHFDRARDSLASNMALVKRLQKIMTLMELEAATPTETRHLLGI
jgi:uncharacterized protein (DUF849 family)